MTTKEKIQALKEEYKKTVKELEKQQDNDYLLGKYHAGLCIIKDLEDLLK